MTSHHVRLSFFHCPPARVVLFLPKKAKSSSYSCNCTTLRKFPSLLAYLQERKYHLKISSYAEFLSSMADHGSEGLSVSRKNIKLERLNYYYYYFFGIYRTLFSESDLKTCLKCLQPRYHWHDVPVRKWEVCTGKKMISMICMYIATK